MTNEQLTELKGLWTKFLGADCPDDLQWELWAAMNAPDVIRYAVLKCAGRNRIKPMDEEFRVRYISSVISNYDGRPLPKSERAS
jgi:hypothetical protein